jgi:RNA polymerase sigma-70 factor (ECF subfamily)
MEDRRYAGLPHEKTEATELEALAADLERQFRGVLRLFAARRLGNSGEAEDVAQETLRIAIEALRNLRITNVAAVPAFIFQTARNLCMRRTRSAAREGKALRRFAAAALEPEEHPLARLIREERKKEVRLALSRLDASDRELLEMSYGEELPTEEIGRRLGISSMNVRVRRHRAIKRLAELLGVTPGSERELKD